MEKNLEDIIGEELSENYIIVPVNEDNYNALKEVRECDIGEFDEEFYQFFFFKSVDGLSWKRLQCSEYAEELGELAEGVERQRWDEFIISLDEWPLVVDVDANGIRYMELTANADIGEVYKEKCTVIDVNQVIEKIKEYFSLSYIAGDTNIYNIELCYSSSFSDKEDGLVRNIVTPYWIVDYINVAENKANRIIYDVYTGEFIAERGAVE